MYINLAHTVSRSLCLPGSSIDFGIDYKICYLAVIHGGTRDNNCMELTIAFAIERAVVFLLENAEYGSIAACRKQFDARMVYLDEYTLYWRHSALRFRVNAAGDHVSGRVAGAAGTIVLKSIAEKAWTAACEKVQRTRLLLLNKAGTIEAMPAGRILAEAKE